MTRRPSSTPLITPKSLVLPQQEHPSRRVLGWLVLAVLALHLALIWGMTGSLDWRLPTDDGVRVTPLQTRWIPPVTVPEASPSWPRRPKPARGSRQFRKLHLNRCLCRCPSLHQHQAMNLL